MPITITGGTLAETTLETGRPAASAVNARLV